MASPRLPLLLSLLLISPSWRPVAWLLRSTSLLPSELPSGSFASSISTGSSISRGARTTSVGLHLASATPRTYRIEHPAMRGWEEPSLPSWDDVIKGEKRKVVCVSGVPPLYKGKDHKGWPCGGRVMGMYNPGGSSIARNGTVLAGHVGGLYDHIMVDHLKSVCDSGAGGGGGKPCKRKVCALARGEWCKEYYNQGPIPWRPPPRGDKDCPATKYGACNGVGSCQYDLGVCLCPAGWKGPDCGLRDPRPCTHRYRQQPLDGNNTTPISHSGPDGRDLNWLEEGWTASRCAGYCDEDLAMCYCPPGTKYGRTLAPPDAPPGTPPLQAGRPMGDSCKPGRDPATGKRLDWGRLEPDDLFGPDGWCNSENPRTHWLTHPHGGLPVCHPLVYHPLVYHPLVYHPLVYHPLVYHPLVYHPLVYHTTHLSVCTPLTGGPRLVVRPCGCLLDGSQGHFCDTPTEAFCFNQCSGHGECKLGFCKCHEGWYGMDCSRLRASAKEVTKGDHEGGSKSYLQGIVVNPPAAQDPPPVPTRRRPLIYVYDTDPIFNTKMIQYRLARTSCVYRLFGAGNDTFYNNFVYTLESYWIEMLTISQHRTFDPEEADFFFVPVQLTCYLWPVLGWADHPWFGMPAAHSRAHQGASMYLSAKRWIQQHYPRVVQGVQGA
ncbi:acetylglucosaminyltransferase, partial [Volvox carteri f. nagariensis]